MATRFNKKCRLSQLNTVQLSTLKHILIELLYKFSIIRAINAIEKWKLYNEISIVFVFPQAPHRPVLRSSSTPCQTLTQGSPPLSS